MTHKINRQYHVLDAEGQIAGRLATKVASLLMGKGKIDYATNVDNGDFVKVTNISALKFSGKKLVNKVYYSHSGYPGGLKETKLSARVNKSPEVLFKSIVKSMLPKNKLQNPMIKRLTVLK